MKNRLSALLAGTALALLALPTQAADLKRAEEIVGGRCFLCHGMEGEAASALYPRLAGQHADYIARQLADFKCGRRKSDTMAGMAADLSAEEMKDLGAFFQKKPATRSETTDADLAGVGRYIFTKGTPSPAWPPASPATGPRATAPRSCRAWPASRPCTSRTSSSSSTPASATTTTP